MMKIVCISDTHGQHQAMEILFGKVLIHAGDVSKRGSKEEVLDFYNGFRNSLTNIKYVLPEITIGFLNNRPIKYKPIFPIILYI